jgi:hypothetical protein
MQKIFNSGQYTPEEMDRRLAEQLQSEEYKYAKPEKETKSNKSKFSSRPIRAGGEPQSKSGPCCIS